MNTLARMELFQVMDYKGGLIPLLHSVTLTHGKGAGLHAHRAETSAYGEHVWLISDEDDVLTRLALVRDWGNELIPQEKANKIDVGTYAGEFAYENELVEITCGPSQGLLVLESDGLHISYGNNTWLDSEESNHLLDELELVRLSDERLYPMEDACYIENIDKWVPSYYACYVEELGEYHLKNDCVFSENLQQWIRPDATDYFLWDSDDDYHDEEEEEGYPGKINGYHCGIKPRQLYDCDEWSIGFEVEKSENMDEGDSIPVKQLFSHWETDSSCGIEGVTNILPLDIIMGDLRKVIHNTIDDASELLNMKVDNKCSCHTTISHKNLTMEKCRKVSGLLYALFRHRLNNTYSRLNKEMQDGEVMRYAVVRKRRDGVFEFRLCSHINNAAQLKRRYDLFCILAKAIQLDLPFAQLMSLADPWMDGVYSQEKKERVKALALSFNRYLMEGVIEPKISEFI